VDRQHLQLNGPNFKARITFSHLARHSITHELGEQTETADPKSHTTIAGYKRILKNRCIDRLGKRAALSLEPLEIEQWLKALKQQDNLANPTLDKIRRVMSLGLQARTTPWIDSSNAGSQSDAVRSLHNDQRLRGNDSDSKAGV
jgi:stalled ribosome rescue protein Dom34